MRSSYLSNLLVRVVVSVAGLAGVGLSHAAIYTGNWDPAYGGRFPALGWSANALFNIPDACIAQANGSCAISFLSAQVSFYNATDPFQTTLESYQLTNVPSIGGTASVLGNQVVDVQSNGFFDPFVPSATGPASGIDGGGNYSFNLILDANREAQLWYAPPGGIGACGDESESSRDSCGTSQVAAIGVFAPVPEPASIALVAAGLFGVAVAGRRRGRRARR